MRRFNLQHGWWLALLVATLGLLACGGCKSTEDPDNEASRPWNAPKNWEHGLPSGMMDRR